MIDQESSRRSAELVSPLQRNSAKTVTFWMPIANIAQQKLALITFDIIDNRNESMASKCPIRPSPNYKYK